MRQSVSVLPALGKDDVKANNLEGSPPQMKMRREIFLAAAALIGER
jgi:hypothetical protein